MDEEKNLKMPFFEILNNLGFSYFGNFNYFSIGTLFWSLTRLFLYYQRIVYPIHMNKKIVRAFMESDIESFIIRQRIILNDIAYIIRQLLPKRLPGLKNPKGPVHPLNKEMRIIEIIDSVEKHETEFKVLHKILKKNKNWILEMKSQRDGIVHFKSKVILFETAPDISFAIIDAAGTEKTEPMDTGGTRVVMTPVFKFINTRTRSLLDFLNIDLKEWLEYYIKDKKMTYKEVGKDNKMSCIGIPLFKEINKIK